MTVSRRPILVHADHQTKDMIGVMRKDLAFLRKAPGEA
jgi:hypothetical protein